VQLVEHGIARVDRTQISLERKLASAPSPVFGDRVQVAQVILNLVLNGIEAMVEVTGGHGPRAVDKPDDRGTAWAGAWASANKPHGAMLSFTLPLGAG